MNQIVSIDGIMAFHTSFVRASTSISSNEVCTELYVFHKLWSVSCDYWKLFLVLEAKTCLPCAGRGKKILGKDIIKVGILR